MRPELLPLRRHTSAKAAAVYVPGHVGVESPALSRFISDLGGAMIARITHYRIREGKMEEFASTVKSLTAAMDKLAGFRVLLILRGEESGSRDAMAISVWDSAVDLKNSDNNEFYYDVLSHVLSCCETFSPMHQQEVLVSKFANPC